MDQKQQNQNVKLLNLDNQNQILTENNTQQNLKNDSQKIDSFRNQEKFTNQNLNQILTQQGPLPKAVLSQDKNVENNLTPEQKILFKNLVETQVQEALAQQVQDIAIMCDNEQTQVEGAIQACQLCDVTTAYLLTDQNWLKVGVANNQHKQIYQEFLQEISNILNNNSIYASFNKDKICLVSIGFQENNLINLNTLLNTTTGKGLEFYQLNQNNFANMDTLVKPSLFQIIVNIKQIGQIQQVDNFQGQMADTSQFTYQYENMQLILENLNIQEQLTSDIMITVDQIIFLQENFTSVFFGSISTKGLSTNIHFASDQGTYLAHQNTKIDIYMDQLEDSIQLITILGRFFETNIAINILQNINNIRGLKEIQNLIVQKAIISYNILDHSFSLMVNLQDIDEFSISPSINLSNCKSWLKIYSTVYGGEVESINFYCNMQEYPETYYLQLIKTPLQENYMIKINEQEILWQDLDEKFIHTIKNHEQKLIQSKKQENIQQQQLLDKLSTIFDFQKCYIHNPITQLKVEPKTVYHIDGELGNIQWETIANLQYLITPINGQLRTYSQVMFGPEPLKNILNMDCISFPDFVKVKSTFIFTSNYDTDINQFSYLKYPSFGPQNQDMWKKGIQILHIYDFDLENCIYNTQCHYIAQISKRFSNLHLKSFKDDFSKVFKQEQTKKLSSFTLESVIEQKTWISKYLNIEEGTINYQLIGDQKMKDFPILIEQGQYYIKGTLNLDYLKDIQILIYFYTPIISNDDSEQNQDNTQQVLLIGQARNNMKNPFSIENMEFANIIVKQNITKEQNILKMTALSIIGKNCSQSQSQQNIDQDSKQQQQCFYGNVKIEVDLQNGSNSYFEGYFPQFTVQKYLETFFEKNQDILKTKINQKILDIELPKGAIINYAFKNKVSQEKQEKFDGEQNVMQDGENYQQQQQKSNQNNNENINKQYLDIEQGISLYGSAIFMGLQGYLNLNIDINRQTVQGKFHFSTVSLAGGNIVVMEEDLILSNNIFISSWQNNKEYRIDLLDNFFSSKYPIKMEILNPLENDITSKQFVLNGELINQHIQNIQNKLMDKVIQWVQKTKNIMEQFKNQVQSLQVIVEQKQNMICQENLCFIETQCTTPPERQCVQYAKKQVCIKQEEYCLEFKQVCTQTQSICYEEEKVCKEWVYTVLGAKESCKEYETVCYQQMEICQQIDNQCIGQSVQKCIELQEIDDEYTCELYAYNCPMTDLKSRVCIQECQRRWDNFTQYKSLLEKLEKSKEKFDQKITNFIQIYNMIHQQKDHQYLNIKSVTFNKKLEYLLNQRSLDLNFQINYFQNLHLDNIDSIEKTQIQKNPLQNQKKDIDKDEQTDQNISNIIIENYDFNNEDQMINNLFLKLLDTWAEKYDYDKIINTQDASTIILNAFEEFDQEQNLDILYQLLSKTVIKNN